MRLQRLCESLGLFLYLIHIQVYKYDPQKTPHVAFDCSSKEAEAQKP